MVPKEGLCALLLRACQVCINVVRWHCVWTSLSALSSLAVYSPFGVPTFCYWFPFVWRIQVIIPFHSFLSFNFVLCCLKVLLVIKRITRLNTGNRPYSLLFELVSKISDFVVLTGPVSTWTSFSIGHQENQIRFSFHLHFLFWEFGFNTERAFSLVSLLGWWGGEVGHRLSGLNLKAVS